jgi:hypothetical protein
MRMQFVSVRRGDQARRWIQLLGIAVGILAATTGPATATQPETPDHPSARQSLAPPGLKMSPRLGACHITRIS